MTQEHFQQIKIQFIQIITARCSNFQYSQDNYSNFMSDIKIKDIP